MHRETIDNEFRDLVESGRLLLMDRFLDRETYRRVFAAVDLMAVPYPGFFGVSSVLLESLAAGRPVLANGAGWCGEIVRTFDAGSTCDVLDPEDFARTLRHALNRSETYTETDAIKRLVAFHHPENFAACWLDGIRRFSGEASVKPLTWDWVTSALSGARVGLLGDPAIRGEV